MLRSLITCIVILFGLTSCTPVLKMIYGVKKPKPKTDIQVIEYTKKIFDKEYEIYRPIDSTSYYGLIDLKLIRLPGIAFFDSNGGQKSIHQDTIKTCTASADNFISQLDLLENAPDMSLNKSEVIQHLNKINFKEIEKERQIVKYSIIIFWADWIGPKLNKQNTEDWLKVYNELDQQSQDNIDLIIVNMDLLEGMEY